MKIKLIVSLCSVAFALATFGQTPPANTGTPAPGATSVVTAPAAPPTAAAPAVTVTTAISAPAVVATPVAVASATPNTEDDFDRAIEKKVRRHFNVTFDGNHGRHDSSDDVPWVVLPIVLIVFATPVMIVATILYFSFSNRRAMHKTVRMMVEKGQPVPEALLNPPPVVRQRSDLRRGVIMLMIGVGLMIFFGASQRLGRRGLEHRHHSVPHRAGYLLWRFGDLRCRRSPIPDESVLFPIGVN